MVEQWRRGVEEAAAVLGTRATRDAPLGARTTYRVGGPAALLVEVSGLADLELAGRAVRAGGVPVLVVGRGSNLLVADAGFRGLAVVMAEGLDRIELDAGSGRVRAGGAASLPVLARRAAAAGLGGLEWSVGVPGSVGGAVRMNAGGHGSDIAASLVRVGLVDLAADPAADPATDPATDPAADPGPGGEAGQHEVPAGGLQLGYRSSAVTPTQVVTWAEFTVGPREVRDAEAEVAAIVAWRRANQPGGQNAGSIFTNPPGDSAGRLIEAAGVKGLSRGSATVSSKHANFVQAGAGGSADDVFRLALEVRRRVEDASGVRLDLELRLVGFDGDGR
ncbi:MAG: FAD-binding protein [Acidimicrobiales bacterium]